MSRVGSRDLHADGDLKTLTSVGNSEILKKWSEIQTVIISHIYLSKNTWGAKI